VHAEGFENVHCTKSNTERNWHYFSQHSVCTVNIFSQTTKAERNECSALSAVNDAKRNVQANVKTGLSPPPVTVSTSRMIYMTYLSNFTFQFGQICYYFYMFSVQTIVFFLLYEVPSIFLSSLCYISTLLH
jgi:hypothetical protein